MKSSILKMSGKLSRVRMMNKIISSKPSQKRKRTKNKNLKKVKSGVGFLKTAAKIGLAPTAPGSIWTKTSR